MDQELSWWAHGVFDGWRQRPGPRYQRLAAALLDAVEDGRVSSGVRLPAERLLSEALGVSRGTVVTAFDQLVQAGIVRRRQGAGTFVAGRPSWLRDRSDNPAAALLLRRLAGRESLDLSLSVPPGIDHLPEIDWSLPAIGTAGHGLNPAGLAELREQLAHHLTERMQLPTTSDQLVITAGAQQALAIVGALVSTKRASLITGCPTYPGLRSALTGRPIKTVAVPGEAATGPDPEALTRSARQADSPVIYVMPTGSNPTGSVMPITRRSAVLEAARVSGALIVEDLSLADLTYQDTPPPPLAAMDDAVLAIGSLDKLFWGGLRLGWIRTAGPLRNAVVDMKAAFDLGTAAPSQHVAARLLAAVDDTWISHLRAGLAARRDRLIDRLGEKLPSWRVVDRPAAGLSLWVELPVKEADTFCQLASAHGVVVAPGSVTCLCGRHRQYTRISFAHPIDELDVAVDRLSWAWAAHCQNLAATPTAAI